MKRILSIIVFISIALSAKSQVSNAKFNPFTYEELLAPVMMYQEAYNNAVMQFVGYYNEAQKQINAADANYEAANFYYNKCVDLNRRYRNALIEPNDLLNGFATTMKNKGIKLYNQALYYQNSASTETDSKFKHDKLEKRDLCLFQASEPLERAFSMSNNLNIKKDCGSYLVQIFRYFKNVSNDYMDKYTYYNSFMNTR